MDLLAESGAVLRGHFLLSSGLHSDTYFQMAIVFQTPRYGEACARGLAELVGGERFDAVIGPAVGGILLSYELGRILGIRTIFAEREQGAMTLRRGFRITPGERLLVCEDVITTGGSVKETIEVVRAAGGTAAAACCIVQRGETDLGCRLERLVRVDVKQFPPADCPLCKEGSPPIKPGSRPKPAAAT